MFGSEFYAAFAIAQIEREVVEHARASMAPEDFAKWEAERTAERRHRELCRSIEKAGENARPRGLGVFW
jgi:hypothetical protein